MCKLHPDSKYPRYIRNDHGPHIPHPFHSHPAFRGVYSNKHIQTITTPLTCRPNVLPPHIIGDFSNCSFPSPVSFQILLVFHFRHILSFGFSTNGHGDSGGSFLLLPLYEMM